MHQPGRPRAASARPPTAAAHAQRATRDGAPPDVLVVGEALVDIVHRHHGGVDEAPGGSPANVALTLGRLGRRPRLLTSLGADARGDAVRKWLQGSGVRVRDTPADRTSTATAHLDADGSATYELAIRWDVDASTEPDADALHVGSIAALAGPGAVAVSALVDRHRGRALVTYDPNIRPALLPDADDARRRVLRLIGRSDVVKASDEDAAWLHPGEALADVARRWRAAGPALVVITRGPDGALAVTDDLEVAVPGVRTAVVDTVGAGDTFMGALVDGLLAEHVAGVHARARLRALPRERLTAILRRAAAAAAVTVSRPGADPPTRAELDVARVGGGLSPG